ncbi:hypothetical protein [Dyadobacter sp. CY356]|uniref:hypothetical protein n=1 Tax=Dyadobacter sp. CY356 TaxID=2906442 RepID=UPI001F3E25A7|nr:hypothetical protein [Dyadobacter sp. CY356]MCF0056626.1 hypothetical protein [Dyadobacter sp. CY356]
MKEFPDDELDKLFRKSAEELDSNFDPEDWNALRNRLDENDGRTPAAWFKKWWPAGMLALLMLAGLTTYLLTNEEGNVDKAVVKNENQFPESAVLNKKQNTGIAEKSENDTADTKSAGIENDIKNAFELRSGKDLSTVAGKQTDSKSASSEERKVLASGSKNAETDHLNKSENELEGISNNKNRIAKSENGKILPRRRSKAGGVYLAPNHSIGRRGDGAFLSDPDLKIDGFLKQDFKKTNPEKLYQEIPNLMDSGIPKNSKNNFPIDRKEVENVLNTSGTDELSRLNISASNLKSRSLVWKKSNSLPEIEVKEADILPVSEPVKAVGEKEATPKFAVRFSYSPDISSVGLKNFTKPGTAVSLLVEYAVLKKLYIQTGVARSSKVYKAEGGEYEWPSSWNDQTVRPYSTDGTCKVIEIPLNLRYDIFQGTHSRWFAGAGASSYYMQNEKYDYNYKPNATGVKWPGWEGSTGWYWLSHINASAGYEYRVSKNLSLLAEPYVRIPVKKVGFGKVDLFTTGVWFSIRYTPLFKK